MFLGATRIIRQNIKYVIRIERISTSRWYWVNWDFIDIKGKRSRNQIDHWDQ